MLKIGLCRVTNLNSKLSCVHQHQFLPDQQRQQQHPASNQNIYFQQQPEQQQPPFNNIQHSVPYPNTFLVNQCAPPAIYTGTSAQQAHSSAHFTPQSGTSAQQSNVDLLGSFDSQVAAVAAAQAHVGQTDQHSESDSED